MKFEHEENYGHADKSEKQRSNQAGHELPQIRTDM